MAGDFSKPVPGDAYVAILQGLKDIIADAAKGFDPALALGTLNTPTNAIRWSSASLKWQKYNGSSWVDLASSFAISITGSAASWTTGRTISLTGDVSGTSGTFNGTANLSFAVTLATVTAAKGGTGQTSYAVGDLLYASGATALSKLADVATGNALLSGGVGVAPAWGKIGLTTHVSGTLPAANGGSGIASYTVGDLLYASGATALSKLAGVATGNVLISGGVGMAFSWGKVSLTTHVSGTLPVANGGTGLPNYVVGDLLYASATTALARRAAVAVGSVLRSAGVGVAPVWGTTDIPSGSRMVFNQTSAPTGWTKDTTAALNDSVMRIVTGTVGSGGAAAFSTWNAQTATSATTLTTAEMPAHTHTQHHNSVAGAETLPFGSSGVSGDAASTMSTSSTGGGGSHTHGLGHNVKYNDFIIAAKD